MVRPSSTSPDRWQRLMTRLGAPPHGDVHRHLVEAYAERHRHYHTMEHVADCLDQLDLAATLAAHPDEVELALWFHDAVYRPRATDNEVRSADWAREFLRECGLDPVRCARVHDHILATRHAGTPPAGDATLVVDIDLSILGRDPETYDRFEQQVRAEYRWVPRLLYRRKRVEILESFLEREAIYGTRHFRARYEEQARRNLRAAVAALLG